MTHAFETDDAAGMGCEIRSPWCTMSLRTAVSGLVLAAGLGCATSPIPIRPPSHFLGCYRLAAELPESYADSLGYEIPDVFRLADWGGQWTVLPTSFEWHPYWVRYDALPSGRSRRTRRSPSNVIPGDSIDVYFPGPIGSLALRLGETDRGLEGRSEWVRVGAYNAIGPIFEVSAPSTSCEDLASELKLVR